MSFFKIYYPTILIEMSVKNQMFFGIKFEISKTRLPHSNAFLQKIPKQPM